MWIFTQIGFFSVVAKQSDPSVVKVRARVREDLENAKELLETLLNTHPESVPPLEIYETKHRDYPYRMFVPKALWARAAAALAEDIDYTNFKGAVGAVQGYKRSKLYGKVWSVMYDAESRLEPKDERSKPQARLDI